MPGSLRLFSSPSAVMAFGIGVRGAKVEVFRSHLVACVRLYSERKR